ncbi:MAG: Npt1/Npt2 family nucleotide transporter [Gemmatimonadetes bacterium]|nr:Npt1/Npt2 family nucleotide transporter [Gemmatimonadota bacterium]
MSDWAARLMNFKRGELPLGVLAALFYFCVLCGYFFLRPVREAMGVSRGMDELRWLFLVTSLSSLVIVLCFGGVVSKLDRRRFIPIGYLFVIACLFAFSVLLIVDAGAGGGLIGTNAETGVARGVGYTFYVWLSVINLFVNSLFWAYMVDVFDVEQGKRMFAFIGIGGTLGAIVGGWATNVISGMTDSVYLPAGLMLTGAALFGAAIVVMLILDKTAAGSEHSNLASGKSTDAAAPKDGEQIGGSFLDGVTAVATSPYLLGIGGYIVLMAIANTMIYFTQATVILDNTDTFSQRVGSFAQFDMLAQIATLITQIFITTHLIRRLGVGWTLAILPVVTVAGFAILAVWPIYGVMAIFQALHRATRYAVSRPARETLFSVVPPAEKYKAKPVVDVFLYRGGDVAGAGIDGALRALGLGLAWVAAATVPLAAMWAVLSIGLGRAQARRVGTEELVPQSERMGTRS